MIEIRGAREHNLRAVDLDVPRNRLVVFTGLSGSGKSSLAFDTIYAEGQRRYVESLSAYARQFLEMMHKPDVDRIDGLSPAISIEQKTTSKNPRSTVATVTEIYDYLRLLFARVGVPHSPATGLPIVAQTVPQMVDRVLGLGDGARILLLAPLVRSRKGEHRKLLAELTKQGFSRVRVNGEMHDLADTPEIDRKRRHDIEVVVDRLRVRAADSQRLSDSIETALKLAEGLAVIETVPAGGDETGERILLSEKFACPVSGFTLPEVEPRLFSFNAPAGACPACDGIGEEPFFDPALVVPNPLASLRDGAIEPFAPTRVGDELLALLLAVADAYGLPPDEPWGRLPEDGRKKLLHGGGEGPLEMSFRLSGGRQTTVRRKFGGILSALDESYSRGTPVERERLERWRGLRPCSSCGGDRLRPEALCVRIDGRNIAEVARMNVADARRWIAQAGGGLGSQAGQIAAPILKEVDERLGFLNSVGLSYLTLDRKSGSLSGGESQRIRLASQIGSGLAGVLYVLDEPSIGLHQRDNARLIATLKELRDKGNTVVVVEHDEDTLRSADMLVDLGPGAGEDGGRVVACGTAEEIQASRESITGDYLSGRRRLEVPETRRQARGWLGVAAASGTNLRGVHVTIPLGCTVCVHGVAACG